MQNIKTYLPVFTGFYNTYFDSDHAEENVFMQLELIGDKSTSDDIDFNYADYRERVAFACTNAIENYLKLDGFEIKFTYEGIESPREYNFTNDKIKVSIDMPKEDFRTLKRYCFIEHKEDFQTFLTDHYASRPGFVSFVGADINDWALIIVDPDHEYFANCLRALFNFYFENEEYTDYDLSSEIDNETSHIDYNIKAV